VTPDGFFDANEQYLVIRADGEARVVRKARRLRVDEVAYRLRVRIPNAWGEVAGEIDVTMPPPPDAPSVEPKAAA
jgi:hypothetical protein